MSAQRDQAAKLPGSHRRDSDRPSPAVLSQLHERIALQWPTTRLQIEDRYSHWEDPEIGVPPVETIFWFLVEVGLPSPLIVEAKAMWPDGEVDAMTVTFIPHSSPDRWFAVADKPTREALTGLGFRIFGDWRSTWAASGESVDKVLRQIDQFAAMSVRVLRETDLPPGVPWPGRGLGSTVTSADRIGFERPPVSTAGPYDLVFEEDGTKHLVRVDGDGLAFVRWWQDGHPGWPRKSPLSSEQLADELASTPDPVAGIDEDPRWLGIGAVRVSKVAARIEAGLIHPMLAATRFELQQFNCDGRDGSAIILVGCESLPDYFVGWVPAAQATTAAGWVSKLNAEVANRLSTASAKVEAESLIVQFGSEYAPDSPWGLETIELTRFGELEYQRRHAGSRVAFVRGHVDPARVVRLHELLATTAFPSQVDRFFPPGASICTIATDPPWRSMLIGSSTGLRTPGYTEILSSIGDLCAALRELNTKELASWGLMPTGSPATETG